MKIVTVQFDYAGHRSYGRLFEVFRASCRAMMPNVTFEALRIDPPDQIKVGYSTGMNSNVHKLRVWQRVMEEAKETVVFCDCDMIAVGSVEDVDDMDFDLAYTKRKYTSIPINGGVVFVRPTEAGRAAMRRWNEVDDMMFSNHELHKRFRRKYAGMNQAAFGYLLERHADIAKFLALPCARYNSCCDTWPEIGSDTRLVHIKGPLRRGLLAGQGPSMFQSYLRPVVEAWKKYDGSSAAAPRPRRDLDDRRELPATTLNEAAGLIGGPRRAHVMITNPAQFRRRYRRV